MVEQGEESRSLVVHVGTMLGVFVAGEREPRIFLWSATGAVSKLVERWSPTQPITAAPLQSLPGIHR